MMLKGKRMRSPLIKTVLLTLSVVLFQSALLQAEENTIPAPPEGNLRYSITVKKFDNEANWRGRYSLGEGMKTIMTDLLHQSGWFITLGDDEMRNAAMQEQDFAATGRTAKGKKSAKMGRMTPAQLLVRGSITHVQEVGSKKAGFNYMGISLGGDTGSAEINFTVYLVDSETGQVVASTNVVGDSGRTGYKIGYSGSELGGLRGMFGGEDTDNVGKAAEDAVGQAVNFLIQQLEDIPWEGTIIMAKGDKIIINRGSRDGVSVGKRFKVGEVEELVDPDTGEVLDVDMTTVGKLEVTKVKEKIAYTKVTASEGDIRKGMSVFEDK